MSKIKWRDKYGKGGVCDFKQNYDFYFKWLLNKTMQVFVIKGLEGTKINGDYLKANLILDGDICITDFNGELYCCVGDWGGEPDEYYIPSTYIIANPILGSKTVYRRDFKDNKQNGVVICNTDIDRVGAGVDNVFSQGLYDLISQTATLLADNIVSINCQQINGRAQAFFTAESKAQAEAAENILKDMYAGKPFKVLTSDIVEKLTVNPMANTSVANNIAQLIQLQNFIIANFFQSIGIKSNDILKKEKMIQAEVTEQNHVVALSLLECVTSWQKGFNEVSDLYEGTNISVELNPVLIQEIVDTFTPHTAGEPMPNQNNPNEKDNPIEQDVPSDEPSKSEEAEAPETEQPENAVQEEPQEETVSEVIDKMEEVVTEIVDTIIDEKEEKEEGEDEDADKTEVGEVLEQSTVTE